MSHVFLKYCIYLYIDMWCPYDGALLFAAQVVVGLPNVGRPLKHGEL